MQDPLKRKLLSLIHDYIQPLGYSWQICIVETNYIMINLNTLNYLICKRSCFSLLIPSRACDFLTVAPFTKHNVESRMCGVERDCKDHPVKILQCAGRSITPIKIFVKSAKLLGTSIYKMSSSANINKNLHKNQMQSIII